MMNNVTANDGRAMTAGTDSREPGRAPCCDSKRRAGGEVSKPATFRCGRRADVSACGEPTPHWGIEAGARRVQLTELPG